MNGRLIQPRLAPEASTALVITRPWYVAETATRAPDGAARTRTGACRFRKARSSAKVAVFTPARGGGCVEGGATAGQVAAAMPRARVESSGIPFFIAWILPCCALYNGSATK